MKKPTSRMTLAEAREHCLELERKSEWKRRQSRQGRFERSFESYDALVDRFTDPTEIATFSDGGKGAEEIVGGGEWERRKKWALNKLRRWPDLQKTLRLIIRNGNNREESIWELMQDDLKLRASAISATARSCSCSSTSRERSETRPKKASKSGQPEKS